LFQTASLLIEGVWWRPLQRAFFFRRPSGTRPAPPLPCLAKAARHGAPQVHFTLPLENRPSTSLRAGYGAPTVLAHPTKSAEGGAPASEWYAVKTDPSRLGGSLRFIFSQGLFCQAGIAQGPTRFARPQLKPGVYLRMQRPFAPLNRWAIPPVSPGSALPVSS